MPLRNIAEHAQPSLVPPSQSSLVPPSQSSLVLTVEPGADAAAKFRADAPTLLPAAS